MQQRVDGVAADSGERRGEAEIVVVEMEANAGISGHSDGELKSRTDHF